MRSLLRVELTRLRWRRAVLLLVAACVLVPAVIAVATIWNTRPVSEEEIASVVASSTSQIQDCTDHPRRFGVPRGTGAQACEDLVVGWYTAREPLRLAHERDAGSGLAVTAVLVLLLMLLGTTFAGHDWNSGSMSNQLLFEPRRTRVWAAKGAAVLAVAGSTAALVGSAYWLALWAVAGSRERPMADGVLWDCVAFGLRGAALAAAAALGAYAVTMLFRSTVATVGLLFAVAVAGSIVLAGLGVGSRWDPTTNVAAVIKNGTTYWVETPQRCYDRPQRGQVAEGSECDQTRELPLSGGVAYYGVLLLAAGGASVLSFRRRDVP